MSLSATWDVNVFWDPDDLLFFSLCPVQLLLPILTVFVIFFCTLWVSKAIRLWTQPYSGFPCPIQCLTLQPLPDRRGNASFLSSVGSFLEPSQVWPSGLQLCPKYFIFPCFQELRIPIIKKWVTWGSAFITACFHFFLLLFPGNIGRCSQAILLFTPLTLCFIFAHSDVFWPDHAHVHVLLSVTVYFRMVFSHPWSLSLLSVLLLFSSYRVSAILVVESSFLLVPGALRRGNNGWKCHFPL